MKKETGPKVVVILEFSASLDAYNDNTFIPVNLWLHGHFRNRAGIFKQFMGARNRTGIGLSHRPNKATLAGGIHSLESIPGPHKRLKIRAQETVKIAKLLRCSSLSGIQVWSSVLIVKAL
jgi:hypothetical protein